MAGLFCRAVALVISYQRANPEAGRYDVVLLTSEVERKMLLLSSYLVGHCHILTGCCKQVVTIDFTNKLEEACVARYINDGRIRCFTSHDSVFLAERFDCQSQQAFIQDRIQEELHVTRGLTE